MNTAWATAAGNPENQDRAAIIPLAHGILLCVADGAGGRSGGTEAAELAVDFVGQRAAQIASPESCVKLLRDMDDAAMKDLDAGETTCAVAVASPQEVFGASVGDSGVWFIPRVGPLVDLTCHQQRKPCIGSGSAWPVPFRQEQPKGTLLLATDGLFKYTSPEKIISVCRGEASERSAQHLIELVRYQSGALPDDVTVMLLQFE